MSKTLVIVESPGKISKISSYLGPEYIVKASYGHVQDLDKKTLSIEIENNFNPLYIVTTEKKKTVKELQALAKDCKDVILAADGDREGEAIAYSLANVLKLKNPKRIIFHEITKPALKKAIENPTVINTSMVNAQQARRLLDRLVGYQISPVVQNNVSHAAKSAGRVQSVVLKIIVDKENEINKSISQPFYKTTGEFEFNKDDTKVKINGTLQLGDKLVQFDSEESVKNFLELINKKTDYKVISVDNKKTVRKPSPPFITSSLQQDASTKLRFKVKQTMDVAQKLYEDGLITYMRTDCPNISADAIDKAKKFIIDKYGKEYSHPTTYESKNSNSQDAHECIRPTDISLIEPEGLSGDKKKLYDLIWKRTIASQMSYAQIGVQIINTDVRNNKESILVFGSKQAYFVTSLENIEFPGYLIVYDNSVEEDSDEKINGKVEIKPKDKLDMKKIKVSQEYTKPPLRYNEAGLVKYLEKNGIGRPSTYSSIISKVIEREYVVTKNIDGVKKESKQFEVDSKGKLKESVKEVNIGKESSKLTPTNMGIMVNQFLETHFNKIFNVEFTADLETYLDKIADGKANWITVLKTFYDMYYPTVEKLNNDTKKQANQGINTTDRFLGNGPEERQVFAGVGIHGPYVKIEANDNNNKSKWQYSKLTEMTVDTVTLDYALALLEWPKKLGKIGNAIVSLHDGEFGLYLKCNGTNYSIKDKSIDPSDIDITYAKQIIESGDPYALKTFKLKDKVINVKNGEYGPFIQIISGNKKQNIPIPKKYNHESITIEQVLDVIASKNGTSKYSNNGNNFSTKNTKSKNKDINV